MELIVYKLIYEVRQVVKTQVLVNFVVEMTRENKEELVNKG